MTKKVVLYSRVSTHNQSIELQEREIREYLKTKPDYVLVEHFSDLGISGSKSSRPELNRLMERAKNKDFDIIIVWKLDRLARSLSHLISLITTFKECNVELVSLRDGIDFTTAQGRLMFGIIGALAEFERELIRERVVAGLQNAKAKGVKLGRNKDLDRDDAVIKDLRERGLSIRAIAKKLQISPSKVYRSVSNSLKKEGCSYDK